MKTRVNIMLEFDHPTGTSDDIVSRVDALVDEGVIQDAIIEALEDVDGITAQSVLALVN